MPAAPYAPSPMDPWPGRKYDWTGAPLSPKLRWTLRRYPTEAVTVISAVVSGKQCRWSTRSVDIYCAQVQGGVLHFEGKLVGDGGLRSSLSLGDRIAEIATFDVEADNAEALGIERGGTFTPGQYVVPLSGGTVEIALTHPRSDWKDRKVLLRGRLSSARYAPDGATLRFTATPRWNSLDAVAMPTIDATSWPDETLSEDQYGKSYPFVAGYVSRHRILRVQDSSAGSAVGVYLVSGLPVGIDVDDVYDADDTPLGIYAGPYRMRDGLGNLVEVVEVTSTDPELYAAVRTKSNGIFDFSGDNPGSIGNLMLYLLARLSGVSGADIDFSGALTYMRQFLHAYGLSLDDGTGVKDIIEGRVIRELYGYISMRNGRYGFSMLPYGDGFRGAPTGAAHLVWGRDLLSGGETSEMDSSEVVNDYEVEWRWDPLSGDYVNYSARTGTVVDSSNSFWLRVSAALNGECAGESVELPDLWRWYDVRSVLRLDERFRALVLRETDYLCVPEVIRVQAGNIVFITDPRNQWERKPFLVTSVGATLRPVVKLYLLEWPGTADVFGVHGVPSGGVHGVPSGPSTTGGGNQQPG